MKFRAPFLVVVFFLATFSLSGCSRALEQNAAPAALTPGQTFTLKNLKGEDVGLADELKGHKVVLLDFWATWCGYCVDAMPDLMKLQEKYSSQGLAVIGVNVGESQEIASRFSEKTNLNFPVVLDSEMTVSQEFGLVGIPTSILISSDGKILGKYHSFNQRLRSDVAKALEAK